MTGTTRLLALILFLLVAYLGFNTDDWASEDSTALLLVVVLFAVAMILVELDARLSRDRNDADHRNHVRKP